MTRSVKELKAYQLKNITALINSLPVYMVAPAQLGDPPRLVVAIDIVSPISEFAHIHDSLYKLYLSVSTNIPYLTTNDSKGETMLDGILPSTVITRVLTSDDFVLTMSDAFEESARLLFDRLCELEIEAKILQQRKETKEGEKGHGLPKEATNYETTINIPKLNYADDPNTQLFIVNENFKNDINNNNNNFFVEAKETQQLRILSNDENDREEITLASKVSPSSSLLPNVVSSISKRAFQATSSFVTSNGQKLNSLLKYKDLHTSINGIASNVLNSEYSTTINNIIDTKSKLKKKETQADADLISDLQKTDATHIMQLYALIVSEVAKILDIPLSNPITTTGASMPSDKQQDKSFYVAMRKVQKSLHQMGHQPSQQEQFRIQQQQQQPFRNSSTSTSSSATSSNVGYSGFPRLGELKSAFNSVVNVVVNSTIGVTQFAGDESAAGVLVGPHAVWRMKESAIPLTQRPLLEPDNPHSENLGDQGVVSSSVDGDETGMEFSYQHEVNLHPQQQPRNEKGYFGRKILDSFLNPGRDDLSNDDHSVNGRKRDIISDDEIEQRMTGAFSLTSSFSGMKDKQQNTYYKEKEILLLNSTLPHMSHALRKLIVSGGKESNETTGYILMQGACEEILMALGMNNIHQPLVVSDKNEHPVQNSKMDMNEEVEVESDEEEDDIDDDKLLHEGCYSISELLGSILTSLDIPVRKVTDEQKGFHIFDTVLLQSLANKPSYNGFHSKDNNKNQSTTRLCESWGSSFEDLGEMLLSTFKHSINTNNNKICMSDTFHDIPSVVSAELLPRNDFSFASSFCDPSIIPSEQPSKFKTASNLKQTHFGNNTFHYRSSPSLSHVGKMSKVIEDVLSSGGVRSSFSPSVQKQMGDEVGEDEWESTKSAIWVGDQQQILTNSMNSIINSSNKRSNNISYGNSRNDLEFEKEKLLVDEKSWMGQNRPGNENIRQTYVNQQHSSKQKVSINNKKRNEEDFNDPEEDWDLI